MTQEQNLELTPSVPSISSDPQSEGEFEGSSENSTVSTVSVDSPHGEGCEGCEGLAVKDSQPEKVVSEFFETFSDKIDPIDLPPLVKDAADTQEDPEDKDCMILGVLGITSGATPNVFGIYDGRRVFPPFYIMQYGPASSNKGIVNSCRRLVEPIEKELELVNLQEQEEYQRQLTEYQSLDKTLRLTTPPPKEPPIKSLWVPANSSSSACYQALGDNDGWGITFETEADTLSNTLSQDYGDYSSGLRAAFHHEMICLRRR